MPTTTPADASLRLLLQDSRQGSAAATRALFERCYGELRALAQRQLLRERSGHSQAPTSLVHEAFVRLHATRLAGDDREQFLRLVATVMRHVLVDSARRRQRRQRAQQGAAPEARGANHDPLLRLDAALQRLQAIDARLLRVVELRFLAGLGVEETARVLGCAPATVKREWRTARAFLQLELGGDAP